MRFTRSNRIVVLKLSILWLGARAASAEAQAVPIEFIAHAVNEGCCFFLESQTLSKESYCKLPSVGLMFPAERMRDCRDLCELYSSSMCRLIDTQKYLEVMLQKYIAAFRDDNFFIREIASYNFYNALCQYGPALQLARVNGIEDAIAAEKAGKNDLEVIKRLQRLLEEILEGLYDERPCPATIPALLLESAPQNTKGVSQTTEALSPACDLGTPTLGEASSAHQLGSQ